MDNLKVLMWIALNKSTWDKVLVCWLKYRDETIASTMPFMDRHMLYAQGSAMLPENADSAMWIHFVAEHWK